MPVETLRPADSLLQRAPFSLRPADSLLQRAPFSLRPADSVLQRAPFSLRPADSLLQRAPFRLLHKGPQFFRQQSESSRLSAVERLEADKAKYVKSQQVALTRQAPIIRKALLPPALIRPAPGRLHSPTGHKVNPRQRHSCTKDGSPVKRGPALDLELLNNLINDVCEGACSPSGSQSGSSSSPSSGAQSVSNSVENRANDGHDMRIINRPQHRPNARSALRDSSEVSERNLTPLTPGTRPPPVPPRPTNTAVSVSPAAVGVASMAVRRVDVKPQTEVRTPRQKRPLKPALLPQTMPPSPPPYTPPLLLPASPAFTRLSNASSRGSARKHAALHRSKSDLSDRFSRADADLERFFNFCGLDPEEARALGTFTRANSDIVSGLHSASSASSEGEEEVRQPEEGQPRPSERVPYGISVIERNARVIKWLYGIRQAREGARESAREGAVESNV